MPYDDGKCDSTHAAWSAPSCGYHSNLYLFATEKQTPCGSTSHYCWKAYGPLSIGWSGATWGSIVADMTTSWPFDASKTWIVTTGTTPYTVQVSLRRCAKFDDLFTERNRTYVVVDMLFYSKVNHAYCAGGSTTQLTASSWYSAEYYGDPYTAAQGISPTVYLKRFRHFDARYCVDAADIGGEGLWQVANPFNFGESLSGSPCPLPSSIAITRTA